MIRSVSQSLMRTHQGLRQRRDRADFLQSFLVVCISITLSGQQWHFKPGMPRQQIAEEGFHPLRMHNTCIKSGLVSSYAFPKAQIFDMPAPAGD